MSLLIDLVKTVKGKSREKVSPVVAQARLNICKACPFYDSTFGTCGTILSPSYDQNGNLLTCGCILSDKTKYADDGCPQRKW